MTVRALIVDDDEHIVRSIEHIVKSLPQPHDCESVGDIAAARKKLQSNGFDYLILDMNLPLEPGRATGRRENGRNLLEWIRSQPRLKHLPVIVVTGEDKGESDFILSVMAIGGWERTRYVQKPIDGDKLEKEIRTLLAAPALAMPALSHPLERLVLKPGRPSEPVPFECGVLVYQDDGVFLQVPERMPVRILTGKGIGHARKILQLLREQESRRFVRRGGERLALLLGNVGIGAVTGAAATIRKNIRKGLKQHLNMICQDSDVLVNDDQGYHLNDAKITIKIIDANAKPRPDDSGENSAKPEDVPTDNTGVPDDTASVRRRDWILGKVANSGTLTRKQIEAQFGIGEKTASRDLGELVKMGKLEFVRTPPPGFYRKPAGILRR